MGLPHIGHRQPSAASRTPKSPPDVTAGGHIHNGTMAGKLKGQMPATTYTQCMHIRVMMIAFYLFP